MKLKRRGIVSVFGLATASVMLAACASTGPADPSNGGADAEPITIRVSHVNPADSVDGKVIEDVAARINEKSGGALILEVYPSGQIGSTSDTAEQAASGEDIITFIDAGTLSNLGNPDLSILGGPFLFENAEQAQNFAKSDLFQEMSETLAEEGGMRILALNWLDGPRHIFGEAAYPSPDDLDGVKLRTPPIETWDRTFQPLGVVTTTIENTEAYSALEQGVVEAAEGPINGTMALKWHEVAPELTLTGHFRTFLGYAIGEQTFQKLTPELQELLIEEFTAGGDRATEGFAEVTDSNLELMKEQGVTVHEADIPAYQRATAGFYEPYGDLLQQVRDAAK